MTGDLRTTELNDFDSIADIYDQLVDWAPYGKWVENLERRLRRRGLQPGAWLLDAACGTGLSVLPWLERGYRVVGVDCSEPMLRLARERLRRAGHTTELSLGDLRDLRLDRRFDAAVCMHSGLDYLLVTADLAQAFRSLRGSLREGGLLAFDKCLDQPDFYSTDYSSHRRLKDGTADFQYHWDRGRAVLVQRCSVVRRVDGCTRRAEFVYHLQATPPDELVAMVEEAGFRVLEPPQQFHASDPGMGIFLAV